MPGRFNEILIVDNNSTDNSAGIVAQYADKHPTIKLIHEAEPGCYAARTTGYNQATGDIIARTDADTRPANNWIETILTFFDSDAGQDYAATAGPIDLYDKPPLKLISKAVNSAPAQETNSVAGPNHAIRTAAWKQVRDTLTPRVVVWEDFDLSLSLQEHGLRIWYNSEQRVATSPRTQRKSPLANWHYLCGGIRTALARGNRKATFIMCLDFPFRLALITASWLIFRPWDGETWKLRRLFRPVDDDRIDSTTVR